MNFSDLLFTDHGTNGATMASKIFDNDWGISVVAGPKGCGLHGILGEDTFEVAIIRPNGNMLEDILPYQTPVQITSLMHLVSML